MGNKILEGFYTSQLGLLSILVITILLEMFFDIKFKRAEIAGI